MARPRPLLFVSPAPFSLLLCELTGLSPEVSSLLQN